MANIFMRFPGGKDKAVTLSYDDAVEQDARLIAIMQKHGLKGTFNVSSGLYAKEGTVYPQGTIHRRMTFEDAQKLYRESGMEVAAHGFTHPFLDKLPDPVCTYEVLQDRIHLESDFKCVVRGMAYPYGAYNDKVVDSLKACGIAYARTVVSTGKFDIPKDWLRLSATCHHNHPRLMELAAEFLGKSNRAFPKLFYLWGHSYEFERDDNWNVIEEFAEYIGNREDVWYATNIEVYDYVMAYERLEFSAAGNMVYNPSCMDIYFYTEQGEFCVKSGETKIWK